MTLPFKLVSADSHIAEPPDLWIKHIDAAYRDRAPQIVRHANADYFEIDGQTNAGSMVGLLATNRKYAEPEARFGLDGWWEDVPRSAYEPLARVEEMDREGIE